MNTQTFTGGQIDWPDTAGGFVFAFSSVPLRLILNSETHVGKMVTVTISGESTITETRELLPMDSSTSAAEFDISRLIQLSGIRTPEDVLGNHDYVDETTQVTVTVDVTGLLSYSRSFAAIPGARDPFGSYFYGALNARIFVNYPWTLAVSGNKPLKLTELNERLPIDTDLSGRRLFSLSPMDALTELSHSLPGIHPDAPVAEAIIERLMSGGSISGRINIPYKISGPDKELAIWQNFTLHADCRNQGEYFRWFRNDGMVGYWLFENSRSTMNAEVSEQFTRYVFNPYDRDDNSSGVMPSSIREVKSESRTMKIGDAGLNASEMELVQSMATSPLVQRYLILPSGNKIWQTVRVLPGSWGYYPKRGLPGLYEIEMTVQLPDTNTVSL